MYTQREIIKAAVLFYFTVLTVVMSVLSIDQLYDAGIAVFVVDILICGALIAINVVVIDKELFEYISLYHWWKKLFHNDYES